VREGWDGDRVVANCTERCSRSARRNSRNQRRSEVPKNIGAPATRTGGVTWDTLDRGLRLATCVAPPRAIGEGTRSPHHTVVLRAVPTRIFENVWLYVVLGVQVAEAFVSGVRLHHFYVDFEDLARDPAESTQASSGTSPGGSRGTSGGKPLASA
jgi:hypothetical protein